MRLRIIAAVGLFSTALTIESRAYEICADLADCQRKAEADMAADKNEDALEALVAVADLATGARDYSRLRFAFESLTSINLKLGRPLKAHAWAQAAAARFEQDARSLANLERARHALPPLSADVISGTYESYAGYGYWSTLKIAKHGTNDVRTEWFMIRYGSVPSAWDYGPVAFWELSAKAHYSDRGLIITYKGLSRAYCQLGFKRNGLAFEWVPPEEDLSFDCRTGGANVLPWGPFWLVDTRVPNLESGN
jgi:hypothetical protein